MDVESIRKGLEKPGKTQRGLARALGLDPAAVNRMLKGERELKASEITAVAQYLELDGTPISQRADDLPPGETMTEAPMLSRHDMPLDVPVYGTAVGGSVGDFQLNGQVVDYIRQPPALTRARNAFAIFYANDSMFPRYETGDPIYVNPSRPPGPGDDVLIEMHGERDGEPGAAYVKRLVKRSSSFIMLQQFNPPRADIKIELTKIRNLWRIVPPKELLAV